MTTETSAERRRTAEREERWRHEVSDTFVPVTVGRPADGDRSGLHGAIEAGAIGRMGVATLRGTPQTIRRTPRQISRLDRQCLLIGLFAGGTARVDQDGRQARVRRGDCVVYEPGRPYEWTFDDHWELRLFALPLGSVQLTEHERRLVTAQAWSAGADGGLTGVVARFLLDLARHRDLVPSAQTERLLAQSSDLVVTLLSSTLDTGDAAHGCAQRSLVLRIKDYIDQRLADPALSPDEIAAAVGISTRYLHKLFQDEHRSVSQYVRNLRLERAHRALLDPRHAHRSISSIAHDSGFGDLSAFNRAFKDTYGHTPRTLRSTPTPPDPGPV